MGDGFKVHKSVVLNKMKDLYLAFVVWVIDNKEVHGVVCKQTAVCCEFDPCSALIVIPLQLYVLLYYEHLKP